MEGHSFSLHLGNQLDWKPLLSNTQSMTIIPSSMSLPSPPASDPSESFLSFIHDYSPSIYNYECKFVEVKGPHDTLSENQKAWINEMILHHIPVEVCKVLPLLITPLSLLDCRWQHDNWIWIGRKNRSPFRFLQFDSLPNHRMDQSFGFFYHFKWYFPPFCSWFHPNESGSRSFNREIKTSDFIQRDFHLDKPSARAVVVVIEFDEVEFDSKQVETKEN